MKLKKPLNKDINEESNQNNPYTNTPHSSQKQNIKIALKKWRFWRNMLIVGAMPFMMWFEGSTSRPYSSMLGVDGEIIGILAGSTNILSCVTNPIWAFCVDKFGFKPVMIIISSLTIILSIYFCILMDNKFFYVIGLYISSVFRGGVTSSAIPHIMQIFGLNNYLIIGGLGRLFTQIVSFSVAVVSIVISIFKKSVKDLLLPYRIVSLVGAGFAIFGLILILYENDDVKFEDEENQKNETNKKNELFII